MAVALGVSLNQKSRKKGVLIQGSLGNLVQGNCNVGAFIYRIGFGGYATENSRLYKKIPGVEGFGQYRSLDDHKDCSLGYHNVTPKPMPCWY